MSAEEQREEMLAALKQSAALLRDADIPFAVGGGFASWSRGGPPSEHDVDFVILESDADRALTAFADGGLRTERPPEGWLVKGWVGDVLIDLIYGPTGVAAEELLERAEERNVAGMPMPVMAADDIVVTKLLAMTEHSLNFQGVLETSRALREQIDWDDVRARVESSPYARAFVFLADELGISSTR